MKLSIVIPTYTLNKHLEELALTAIASFKDTEYYEIIVCEDGGVFSQKLATFADTYIYNQTNVGFTKNVNRGWRYASGDYVAIVNSDIQLMSGILLNLCIPGKVTSPEIINQYIPHLAGPFFVVPKEVTEKRGYLLEEMHTYSSDSEYDQRVRDVFEKVPRVKVFHEMAQTVSVAGLEGGAQQAKDRAIYERLKQEGRAA
jgi:glycosyltransferase involved in cell wall biosynthesis